MAKVLVTGGTGFVGSHTVAALVKAGHDVRMLVRSAAKVATALSPHSVEVTDVVEGDVLDRDAVTRAVDGCDAVLHAANVFSFHPGHHDTMRQVNADGTQIVLEAAAEAGADPIIHVSSYLALLPSSETVTGDSPVGRPAPAYAASKADAENVAREIQGRGAPVVITQPGSVWGPHDPYLGESSRLAIAALKGRLRMTNDGFIAVVDVRDVAAAHTKLVEPGQGGRNFLLVGHNLMFRELISKLGDVTGRGLDAMRIPHGMAMGVGKMMDWIAGVTRARLPIGFEPPWILANSAPGDSSVAESTLGITWRPLEESLRDTVRWLHESGEISDRQAGTLAATAV